MTDSTTPNSSNNCLGRTCLKWASDGELTALDLSLVMERLAEVDQEVAAQRVLADAEQLVLTADAQQEWERINSRPKRHFRERRQIARIIKQIVKAGMIAGLFGFLFAALSFVQVPQWDNDWTKCSVAVPDTACHWYVVNPDNTFGKGFSWITAPKFDVTVLRDIGIQHEVTVAQGYATTVELMDAASGLKYGDDY